jgi:hypothetical protein
MIYDTTYTFKPQAEDSSVSDSEQRERKWQQDEERIRESNAELFATTEQKQ